jgi:hypothetical protein
MLANLDLNHYQLNNLADGTQSSDAATVGQVTSILNNIGALESGALSVANRTVLAALADTLFPAVLQEAGREGIFVFNSANLSAQVTADPTQGIYVAPSSAPTGASGAWVRQFTGPVAAEWFGAKGDGVTNDTAAIQAATNTGRVVDLRNDKVATYLISSGIDHVNGSGLMCSSGRAVLKAKLGSGSFNITSALAPRIGLDRTMYRCNQTDNVFIRNVHFTTDGAAEVTLHGIRLYGGMATEGYDIDCSFSNFKMGTMVAIGGTGNGKNRNIRIRSAVDSGITLGLARFPNGAQTTVVEIDNDKPSAAAAVGGNIKIDQIKNILYSGAALTDFGMETDGVNIVGQGADSTSGWDIQIGKVSGVGEPLDIQGWRNRIKVETIDNAYKDAIKLIHGARDNTIDVGVITSSGRSAVYLSGSDAGTTTEDTSGNVITVGNIVNPGNYGLGLLEAPGDVMVVLFGGTTAAHKPRKNIITIGSILGDGVNLDYIVKDGGSANALDNLVKVGKASGYVTAISSAPDGNVRVRTDSRFYTEMTMSAGQTVPTGVATKVLFNTAAVDIEGNTAITASNKITIRWPGVYRFRAQLRLDGWAGGTNDQWQMEIRQNVTGIGYNRGKIYFAPGKDQGIFVEKTVHVREQDIGTTAADFTVWMQHDVGADRSISSFAPMTYFTAERLS